MADIKHDAVELYSQYKVPEIQKGPAITREETFRELQKSTYDSMILNMSIENSKTQYEDEEVVKNEFIDRGIKMIFLHSIIGYTSFKHLQKSTINDVDFKNAENTLNDSSILNLSILRSKTVSEDHENLKSKKVDMFTDSMVLISPIDSRVTEEYNQQPVESRRFVTLASITESSRILNSVMLRSRYKCKWNEGIKNVLIDKLIQPTFLCTLSPKSRGVMTSHGSLTGTNITKGMGKC
ncbi:hypothetical protein RF11_11133 [Thelohanellus kitauei]|uniref:Uncharacterized protein n=1 Tax=Thelohanellus kitauei TaxID=669202 RepID=A0A0C2MV34_THEKT|nr:hypothetical protein RF11_11133 [Thelohanellus kitauei]